MLLKWPLHFQLRLGLSLILWAACSVSWAQDFNPRTVFDEAPWISARAAGMAEAIDPIANGMEAPYYNPAAIGGLQYKQERPAISHLFFPYLGVAANRSSQSLNKALQEGGNLEDSAIADELLRAYDGDHPYARVSIMPAISFYRVFLAMSYDVRAASTPNAESPDMMDLNYREQSGPVAGMSFASPKRNFYLGITGSYINRSVIEGSFPLATLNDIESRRKAFRENKKSYLGAPVHVSALWNGISRWRPSVSLVARNITNTVMKSRDEGTRSLKVREDLALGLGLSPNLGKGAMLNLVLQANQLTHITKPTKDKLRIGAELTIGNAFGAEAGMSFRTGYSAAGLSGGIGFNFGMFGLQAASFAEDIGAGDRHVVERRSVINLGINIADY